MKVMMKKFHLLLLFLSLLTIVACAPKQEEPAPIPLYTDTIVEDEGPC